MDKNVRELVEKLQETAIKDINIVIMPHFCIDNFVYYGKSIDSFIDKFVDIAKQGGGNLPISQDIKIGGKAANCCCALASLGIKSYLIAKTNELGYKLLEYLTNSMEVNLSYVSRNGDLAQTTAIELKGANVMLSDPGSLSSFGPDFLTDAEKELISKADLVCISDWGLNEKGTELAKYVFSLVKENKKGKTFFDPGDPSPKENKLNLEIGRMLRDVLEKGLVDILSVNEHEVKMCGGINYLKRYTRVDLHSNDYSISYDQIKETKRISTFNVETKRFTGAGDVWNAGDIFGEVMGLPPNKRLLLANSAAAFYVSDPHGRYPTRKLLIDFLEKSPLPVVFK